MHINIKKCYNTTKSNSDWNYEIPYFNESLKVNVIETHEL